MVTNIEHVQEQTARILQEQERDLLRAFRARLFELQTELEKEKSRAEDGAAVWIEKNRQLQKELDWAREMADRLDRHNQSLVKGTTHSAPRTCMHAVGALLLPHASTVLCVACMVQRTRG